MIDVGRDAVGSVSRTTPRSTNSDVDEGPYGYRIGRQTDRSYGIDRISIQVRMHLLVGI